MERIFADSHQAVLWECAVAADESERAKHRKIAASGTQSLVAKANATGAPVTRPAPDAPPAGTRSDIAIGGAAQGGLGPDGAAASPRPQAEAQEECVAIIDDDDCVDIGLETSSSGGAQAAPPQAAPASAAAPAPERDATAPPAAADPPAWTAASASADSKCQGDSGPRIETQDVRDDGPAAGGGMPHHVACRMPKTGLDALGGCNRPGGDAEAERREIGVDADLNADGALRESHWEDGADPGSDCRFPDAAGPGGDRSAEAGGEPYGDEWDDPQDGWESDCAADDLTGSGAGHSARQDGGGRRGGPRIGRWLAAAVFVAFAAGAAMLWTGGDGIGRLVDRDIGLPAAPDSAPEGGAGEIRRMVAEALKDAPVEEPVVGAEQDRRQDRAEDLRGMIADGLDEGRMSGGAGSSPGESAREDGADAPEIETTAAVDVIDAIEARFARIERRLGDTERGAVSAGGLIGTLGAAIADAAARMEAIERDRASQDSRLADLELRTAEADRAGDRAAGLGARLDETDTVVLDLAARVAALEAEADAGAVAMFDAPVSADAPGWVDDWGPDPFAADGPRTQWDNSVDDNPVYRRIPAAARLVRDEDGRLIPVFVETPAGGAPSSAPPPQGG